MKIFDFLQNFHVFEGTPKCCDHDDDECEDEHSEGEEEAMEHDHEDHHHHHQGCCGDDHEHNHEQAPITPSRIKFRFHITSCYICTYNSRPEVVKVFSSSGKSSR